jgi:hypothetical protein
MDSVNQFSSLHNFVRERLGVLSKSITCVVGEPTHAMILDTCTNKKSIMANNSQAFAKLWNVTALLRGVFRGGRRGEK